MADKLLLDLERRPTSEDAHAEVDSLLGHAPSSPSSPFRRSPFSSMRRSLRCLSRRALLLAAIATLCLLALYRQSPSYSPYDAWQRMTSRNRVCQSARKNPHHIVPPAELNRKYAHDLWETLQTTFDAHPPSPSHIDHPDLGEITSPPSKETLDSYINVTMEQKTTTKEHHAALIPTLPEWPTQQYFGRGIVILAGGRYSEFAATSIGMIREVGSRLPIEVWVGTEEENVAGWCEELALEGVACRQLTDYVDLKALPHPYSWKVLTMMFSSFSEILFLDADSMPVRNPDTVFNSKIYKQKGAVVWPDYWKHTGVPWLPWLLGISIVPHDESLAEQMSVESGQIVWNKQRHWKSLLLAAYYNYYGVDYFYSVFNNGWAGWGDKDTFPMALKALNEPYHLIEHGLGTLFVDGSVLGIGMLQADPANITLPILDLPANLSTTPAFTSKRPRPNTPEAFKPAPMFLHCNIIKWSVRNFLCTDFTEEPTEESCQLMPEHLTTRHSVDTNSPIFEHLRDHRRVFPQHALNEYGIDPEPLMWKAMEHSACRSKVWGHPAVCRKVRQHMEQTFGLRWVPRSFEQDGVVLEDVCLEGLRSYE